MTTATATLPFTESHFDQTLSSRQEPGWLSDARRRAWKQHLELPFPAPGDEQWRRTDPERFRLEQALVSGLETQISGLDGGPLSSVVATRLDEALQSPDLEKLFFGVADSGRDLFTALNGALGRGGACVLVPRAAELRGEPIRLEHRTGSGYVLPHTVIHGEPLSTSAIVEVFTSGDEAVLAAPVIEIQLEAGARMQYVHVQEWGARTAAIPRIHARLGRDSELQLLFAAWNGAITKSVVEADLVGPGARCEALGVVFTQGRQHVDCHVQQNHRFANTVSDVLYHMALTGRSRTVFTGNILVEPGAQKIDGYQTNRNLLLSPKARADAMPKLEIEANDVRCSHGASFSSYDPEQQFYLRSRGLTRLEAQQLLVTGFYQEVFDRFQHEPVAEWLLSRLAARMQGALGKARGES
ncbi:MAG: Fe-S cluster assembly protein SufD [Armatimonadetes bacterium]|nr:Fe-S cluster assembly protein SufD [Armatimonadota bacterium]